MWSRVFRFFGEPAVFHGAVPLPAGHRGPVVHALTTTFCVWLDYSHPVGVRWHLIVTIDLRLPNDW